MCTGSGLAVLGGFVAIVNGYELAVKQLKHSGCEIGSPLLCWKLLRVFSATTLHVFYTTRIKFNSRFLLLIYRKSRLRLRYGYSLRILFDLFPHSHSKSFFDISVVLFQRRGLFSTLHLIHIPERSWWNVERMKEVWVINTISSLLTLYEHLVTGIVECGCNTSAYVGTYVNSSRW